MWQVLLHGKGLVKNHNEAARMFKLAADQGHAESQAMYGNCLENGFGVEKDVQQAVIYYKRAADQGDEAGKFCCATLSDLLDPSPH